MYFRYLIITLLTIYYFQLTIYHFHLNDFHRFPNILFDLVNVSCFGIERDPVEKATNKVL